MQVTRTSPLSFNRACFNSISPLVKSMHYPPKSDTLQDNHLIKTVCIMTSIEVVQVLHGSPNISNPFQPEFHLCSVISFNNSISLCLCCSRAVPELVEKQKRQMCFCKGCFLPFLVEVGAIEKQNVESAFGNNNTCTFGKVHTM